MKKFSDLIDVAAQRAMRDDHRIKKVISRIVPAQLLAQLQFCRVENRVLRITLDNASALAKLRFCARQIVDELNADGLALDKVTWHVSPVKTTAEPREKTRVIRERSAAAASILRSTADDMEEDELQRALVKMARQLTK